MRQSKQMHILVLTKRHYTNKDLLSEQYGRIWNLTEKVGSKGVSIQGVCLNYKYQLSLVEHHMSESGVQWASIKSGRFLILGYLLFLTYSLFLAIKRKPDIIWSFSDSIYCIAGYYYSKIFNCISSIDLYDNYEAFAAIKYPLVKLLYRRSIANSDLVFCVSASLATHIKTYRPSEKAIFVIRNGIDKNNFYPKDQIEARQKLNLPLEATIIGAIGDLSKGRGAETLIDLAKSETELSNCFFLFAGTIDDPDRIQNSENVRYIGELVSEKTIEAYNSVNVAVVYNKDTAFGTYCFPQKFYEILACKTPIVAAKVGDLVHILEEHNSVLYDAESQTSLTLAIIKQLEKQYILNIPVPSWEVLAGQILEIYSSKLASNNLK